MLQQILRLSCSALCLAAAAGAALAAPLTLQEIATYQGPDRTERLLEGVRKEGAELTVYHAYPQLAKVTEAFAKKYDIKVTAWRSGSENILQRINSEARANKSTVDIVQNNAPENEAAHREMLLQPVASPYLKDLVPGALPSHRSWVGITLDVYSAAYNTAKVKKEELPKTYRELLDPKWKGRLAVEAEDQAWYATLLQTLGEPQGGKLLGDVIASNGVSVRKGHSLLTSLVASGEVPLALSVYSWNPAQLKAKGAPVEGHLIEPVVAQFSTVAMLKKAPHPNTAALFYDFVLNEGQAILAQMHFVPTSKKQPSPIGDVALKMIDPGMALDMQEEWTKAYLAATRR
ncbi:ABC transporter substrate-binding protein [Massilia niastensis]|uniref:ABC transporter substrate-binding protein n=1 Tax=Massilia niastensis TaxID=544911 RepID=UPI0003A33ABC|nr:extracellular solute-binding protein [Massilia niastensis]